MYAVIMDEAGPHVNGGDLPGVPPKFRANISDGQIVPLVTEKTGTQRKHRLSAGATPTHPGLFHALLNNSFGSRFDCAAADG